MFGQVRKYLSCDGALNIWFRTVSSYRVRRVGEWGDDEEKLYAFLKSGCQRFSHALGAAKKPFELSFCAVSNTPFCDVEVANCEAKCP